MRLTNTAHRKMNSLLRLAACLCCLVMLLCITLPAGAAKLERYLDPDKITSLTMTYRPNGVPLSGVEFRLYRIASVDGDSNFTLLAPFNRYSIQFRRDMSTDEWQGLAETLAGYVVADRIGEAYNRLTIDNMKWSKEKVDIIKASMMEEENFWSYVFPILRYHSRFDELTAEDFAYLFKVRDNTWNGYQMHKEINPLGALPVKRVLADYQFGDICYDYLDRMRKLCEENGAEFILIKAPSVYPYWYDEYDAQIQDYADAHGLAFYNFLDYVDEIGIDYQVDTYDAGLHMNLTGATKLSAFFAEILAENHGVEDHRNDPAIAPIYDEKLRLYDTEAEKE